MTTINGKACVINGTPVDKVFSNGMQVYGRNLSTGTSSDWQKVSSGGWGMRYLCDPIYEIVDGETYTIQVEVRNITSPVMLEPFCFASNNTRDGWIAAKKSTDNDGKIIITFTANLPEGYAYFRPDLAFTSPLTSIGSYEYRRFKIELGSVPTPWTPALEDVLK